VILTILCVKALTLEGAMMGLEFLFTPDWARLAESQVWIDGGTQIFFSYGVGIGALLALGSYNKFNHNCHKDAIVVCCINTFTSFFSAVVIFSILGYMAHSKGVEVKDVVESGPGLAFLVYPEVVLTIAPSPLWAALFFIMLLTLGIDSQFCGVESLMTGLVDNWPEQLQPHRKKFTLGMTVFMFLLGLPMITRGGIYVFQLMDFYGCIEEMIGYRVSHYWYICWVLLAPAFMLFIFVFYFVKYTPIKIGEYEYPPWGELLGFMISFSSMIWVPGYMVYYMLTTPGTWREVLRKGVTPVIVPRAEAMRASCHTKLELEVEVEDVEKQLLQTPEKLRQEEMASVSPVSQALLEEEEEEEEEERRRTTDGILSNNC